MHLRYTNLSGCLVAGVLALCAGQLTEGVAFCLKYPEVMQALAIYSLASAVGQNFIYYTITQFSPLLLTTVTTTRKIFSTLYSVFRDPSNSLSTMQWSGCGLVFVGLFIEVRHPLPAAAHAATNRRTRHHRRSGASLPSPQPPRSPPLSHARTAALISPRVMRQTTPTRATPSPSLRIVRLAPSTSPPRRRLLLPPSRPPPARKSERPRPIRRRALRRRPRCSPAIEHAAG
jgi:hypothetical protein